MPKEIDSAAVKGWALEASAQAAGIAAAQAFVSAPAGFHPTDALPGCQSVVVLGVPFPQEAILDERIEYIDVRNAVNKRLNEAAKALAKRIRQAGYQVRDVGGMSGKWVEGMQHGPISLKHAAALAGLGTIGKNNLLISPTYGTMLWFSAVLTDAALAPDEGVRLRVCDACRLCVDSCPAHALDDPAALDKKTCANTYFRLVDGKWRIRCFLCRKVCPHRFGVDSTKGGTAACDSTSES